MRLLIIGGSDAGVSAALRAQEADPNASITMLLADSFPNYSICGLPFYLSGETPQWRDLAHRSEFPGIEVLERHEAKKVKPDLRIVEVSAGDGTHKCLNYDRLVVATGAHPVRPRIEGIDLPGVSVLHTMNDAFALQAHIEEQRPRSVIIVGAGYIGVEMADALTLRGLSVTLISRADPVFPSVDPELGRVVQEELEGNGVKVLVGKTVESVVAVAGNLAVRGSPQLDEAAQLILVTTGTQPSSAVAQEAGVAVGINHAIRVSHQMETNIPDILAAGDCVETWHRTLGRFVYLPLGTTSHKQGRVAGENAVGGTREFAGSVGTQTVKIFGLAVARTGLLGQEARAAGFDAFTDEIETWDHKHYYPGARKLRIRLTGARDSGRLLGAQIVGDWRSEISKRIDIFATALFHNMTVEDLNDLDLSYTPPFSSPWDPVQMAAQNWTHQLSARFRRD